MVAVPIRLTFDGPEFRGDHYLRVILDRLDRAIIVVDPFQRVQYINDTARLIVSRGDAIAIEQQRLVFLTPPVEHRVRTFLQRSASENPRSGSALWNSLMRASGEDDYRLVVRPLSSYSDRVGSPLFSIEIHDPASMRNVEPQVLRDLFKLTLSEAKVVAALILRGDVKIVAGELGVSTNTVRTHIRAAYAKCEVHSLPQLLQLIASSPR